jgi:hypothetical protein
MPRASLHGVSVDWSTEGGAPDLLAPLGLEEASLEGDAAQGQVEIALRPAPSGAAEDPARLGHAPAFFHGIVQAYRELPGEPPAFLLWDRASLIHVPLEGGPIEALVAAPGREPMPGSGRAALEIALLVALRRHGLFHLHAAAVAPPLGPGVLVAGGSGAGKTTAAVALIESGFAWLGDDAQLLAQRGDNGLAVLAFPRPFHIGPATLAAFPRLGPLTTPSAGHGDKCTLDPRRAFPDRARKGLDMPALVLHPRVDPAADLALAPLPPAEALGLLIAASASLVVEGMPGRDQHLALCKRLASGARHVELVMGPALLKAPSRLAHAVNALLGEAP